MKKGFVLIGSLFLVLFLGVFIGIAMIRSKMQLMAIDLKRASLFAFYAAESGVDNSIYELRKNYMWNAGFDNVPLRWESGGQGEDVGFYTVTVENGADWKSLPTRWITSTGQDIGRRVSRIIKARAAIQNPARFFTSTIGDIAVGTGAAITGGIFARDIMFEIDGGGNKPQITVSGDVDYIRNTGVNGIYGEQEVQKYVRSGYINMDGNINQQDPLAFVSVDLTYYKSLAEAGGRYVEARNCPFSISGDISKANLSAENGVVFAEGDIIIKGAVLDSMTMVAKGNIIVEDSTTCYTPPDGKQRQIGLFAGVDPTASSTVQAQQGDVVISQSAPSTIDIDAFIIADGGLFRAEGTPGSKTELNFEGAIAVRGRSGQRSGVNLNVYRQRDYNYDVSLTSNPDIPYQTSLVNVISWEEK